MNSLLLCHSNPEGHTACLAWAKSAGEGPLDWSSATDCGVGNVNRRQVGGQGTGSRAQESGEGGRTVKDDDVVERRAALIRVGHGVSDRFAGQCHVLINGFGQSQAGSGWVADDGQGGARAGLHKGGSGG